MCKGSRGDKVRGRDAPRKEMQRQHPCGGEEVFGCSTCLGAIKYDMQNNVCERAHPQPLSPLFGHSALLARPTGATASQPAHVEK